jgi:hypothetical protein
MRGEFYRGVVQRRWREIWQPLIDQPVGDKRRGLSEGTSFLRAVSGAQQGAREAYRPKPRWNLLLGDCDPRDAGPAFEGAAQAAANPALAFEVVNEAFDKFGLRGGGNSMVNAELILEAALLGLLGQPARPHLLVMLLREQWRARRKD